MNDWSEGSRGFCRINGFVTRVTVTGVAGDEREVLARGEQARWVPVTDLSERAA